MRSGQRFNGLLQLAGMLQQLGLHQVQLNQIGLKPQCLVNTVQAEGIVLESIIVLGQKMEAAQ